MRRRRIRTVYVIQTARCMVCRLGLRGSGAEHTATAAAAAVIDFSHSFVSNNCKFVNSAFVWRSGDFFVSIW